MGLREKVGKELKELGVTMLYFFIWFGILMALKRLVMEEYRIEFHGLSMALIGALIVAKVVLVLEHVPLGPWVRRQPPVYDVLLRTILYGVGVFVVLLLEKALETRHQHGGFEGAIIWRIENRDMLHIWATTIGVTTGLLWFNVLVVVRHRLGEGALARMFFRPPTAAPDAKKPGL